MAGHITGKGNEQYYKIEVDSHFKCETKGIRDKCDIFGAYKLILNNKINKILPILFKINGEYFGEKGKKEQKLQVSISNFFTKIIKYKKKEKLPYLFPRIRFEFENCSVEFVKQLHEKLKKNKYIISLYHEKFIDQLVFHSTGLDKKNEMVHMVNLETDYSFGSSKWKPVIPKDAKFVEDLVNDESLDDFKIKFSTQKKQNIKASKLSNFHYYKTSNENKTNGIVKSELVADGWDFFDDEEKYERNERIERKGDDDYGTKEPHSGELDADYYGTKEPHSVEFDADDYGTKHSGELDDAEEEETIEEQTHDPAMIEQVTNLEMAAVKQQKMLEFDDMVSEFCVVKQDNKNAQEEYKRDLFQCLNKNDAGKIKIVFKKEDYSVLPSYNLTNNYLRINPNGMKKKFTIELDGLSVEDLLEPEPALDYEGLLNKVDKMHYHDVRKELIANDLEPSNSWTKEQGWGNGVLHSLDATARKMGRGAQWMKNKFGDGTADASMDKEKLKHFLNEKIKQTGEKSDTKPLVEKLLTEFKKMGSDPFFCRKVLDRLKKVYKRKEFHKVFKKNDADGDNALHIEEFRRFIHSMKAPEQDFDELWTRLSHGSDTVTWVNLIKWITSGEWPKPVSIAVSNQKLIYAKPNKIDFQLPKGVNPGSMLTLKIKKEILYENNKYSVDLFVLLEPIPQSAKPGEKLSLRALKLAEPDANDSFDYVIKKEKDGNKDSAFYIKYGNNHIFVKLVDKSKKMYENMKLNQVQVLTLKKVDGQKEEEIERAAIERMSDAEIHKKTEMHLGKTDEEKKKWNVVDAVTSITPYNVSKVAVGTVGVALATVGAVAVPVAAVYGASLGISVIAEEGSSAAEVSEDVLKFYEEAYKKISEFPDTSNIAGVMEAPGKVIDFFSDTKNWQALSDGLGGLGGEIGGFLLNSAQSVTSMLGLSAAAGPILLIALAGLAGLRATYLIAKWIKGKGTYFYELMNQKSLRYDVSSFKIERINLNKVNWVYNTGDEVTGQWATVMEILKQYVIPIIIQDITDPTKPIENKFPIYINDVQYIEEEEQETRSFTAMETDMKNQRAQGIMVTPDMEGMDSADIKKAKVKKNVFYVRFHTNYLTPFKLKGQEFALTSRGETYMNKKLRTWDAFNKKRNHVYFYKGMVSLREINPDAKSPKRIFENIVKKLFKNNLKTLIFDQFSLDEDAANVISERLKEIKNSTVLDMVVLNLLEVPSIIKILKCLADSKIQIKKLIIRRVRDTLGKMKKSKKDELYKMEKRVKKKQKIQQNVHLKSKRGNVLKGDENLLTQGGYMQGGYMQEGGTLFGIFNSVEILGTAVGSANLNLIVLELVTVIKSSSTTLVHLELPGQFGAKSTKGEDSTEIIKKISAAIADVNKNAIRKTSGVGLMNVIFDKQLFGKSNATKAEMKAQKNVYIENTIDMIRDQMEKVQADYDAINEKIAANSTADLLDFGDMHTIETFIHPEQGIVRDLRQSINSLDKSTKTIFGKMKDVKYLLEELKLIESKIYKLKKLDAYKEAFFEYSKFLDDKQEEEELQALEDKSIKRDALKRGYTFDKKAYIPLIIKHDIFDKMKPEKDSMVVRYNDEWNLPEVKFENPDKYRTGKKKYEYKFHFPTSVQKKEAYKRALKLRVQDTFFDNAIKVNYTNKTGNVIAMGETISLIHPVYLVPISIQNPYTDNIDQGETVRLYLRGKVYKNNQMKTDDTNNFQILENDAVKNIVMIGIKDTELTKFTIEDIKNNIISFDSKTENLASLVDIFNMFKQINPTMKLNPDPLKFFNHEQFYIKSGICKRIFYEKDVDIGNIIDNKVNYNNVYVFVYNSSLVSNREVRLNKEYGTIYANLEKLQDSKLISYLEVKTPYGAKKIKDNVSNIKFGRKSSEIYIMSVSKLEKIITEDETKKVDIEYEKNDAMLKAEEAENAKNERFRAKYRKEEDKNTTLLNNKSNELRDEEAKISREIKKKNWLKTNVIGRTITGTTKYEKI